MALFIPHYINAANIADTSVHYQWDDWNVEQAEEPVDEERLAQLGRISQRAVTAITIGIAEWVVYRFERICDITLPLQYLEAAWAMIVDVRYCRIVWQDYTRDSEGWTGPVKRPIALAMIRVAYTFEAILEYGDPEMSAAWLDNMALYVLPDASPYQRWRDHLLERMETLYRRNAEDRVGDVVPNECRDVDIEFDVNQTENLVNRFLADLNYQANPFLNSPERMLQQGFAGRPYTFDFEIDRTTRGGFISS